MTEKEMETLIEKAAHAFNQELQQHSGRPPFVRHKTYNTLLCDERFEKGQAVRISLHGYSFRFLTKENQKLLHFEDERNRSAGFHNHEFFEFIYVYQGNVTQCTPDGSFSLPSHHLLLMNSYVIHSPKPDNDDTVMFNFLVQKEVIERMLVSLSPFDYVFSHFFLESLYGPKRDKNYLCFMLSPETEETVQMILKEYYGKDSCYQQVVYALLIYLLAQIAEEQETLREMETKNEESLVQEKDFTSKLLRYLQEHYLEVTLDSLSDSFGYSKYHLSRLIRQKTGMSFKELITQYKLIHASNYLEYSEFSLSKICELIGYYDKSHFSKAFKAVFGMSPQEYREQKRSEYL